MISLSHSRQDRFAFPQCLDMPSTTSGIIIKGWRTILYLSNTNLPNVALNSNILAFFRTSNYAPFRKMFSFDLLCRHLSYYGRKHSFRLSDVNLLDIMECCLRCGVPSRSISRRVPCLTQSNLLLWFDKLFCLK